MWYLLTKHCKTSSMKNWVCSSWGELRSHYLFFMGTWLPFPPKHFNKFHNFLLSFVVGIITWKCEACSWWVEIFAEMGPTCLLPGPNSTRFRRSDQMDFSPFANTNMFGGQTYWGKWGVITCQGFCLVGHGQVCPAKLKLTKTCQFFFHHLRSTATSIIAQKKRFIKL